MPIRNWPLKNKNGCLWGYIPITIINPHSGRSFRTVGLVDTGASHCTIPIGFALILGHVWNKGDLSFSDTAGGQAKGFKHTTTIEFNDSKNAKPFHAIVDQKVDFLDGLKTVLLGVTDFMNGYHLQVDYPKGRFSLIAP